MIPIGSATLEIHSKMSMCSIYRARFTFNLGLPLCGSVARCHCETARRNCLMLKLLLSCHRRFDVGVMCWKPRAVMVRSEYKSRRLVLRILRFLTTFCNKQISSKNVRWIDECNRAYVLRARVSEHRLLAKNRTIRRASLRDSLNVIPLPPWAGSLCYVFVDLST